MQRRNPEPSPLRVAVADAVPLIRVGLCAYLTETADLVPAGEAGDAEGALRLAREQAPDVLVLGMNLPAEASVAVARQLCEADSPVRVLALSGELEEEWHFFEMLAWRAGGYLSKREAPEAVLQAIRAVARGEAGQISRRIAERVASRTSALPAEALAPLTKAERKVLRLIARGYRNRQIADALSVSPDTVKNHITHLYAKLGVRSRGEAIRWAWLHGMGG